jgi:hypothetical protein
MRRSVRRSRNGMTNRKIECCVIRPKADGAFVANMEVVLNTYAQPHDARFSGLCMDEQPVQLLKETRVPLDAAKTQLRLRTRSRAMNNLLYRRCAAIRLPRPKLRPTGYETASRQTCGC